MHRQLVITQRRCMGGETALLERGAGCGHLLPAAPIAMDQNHVTGIGHPRRMTPAGTPGRCIELAGWIGAWAPNLAPQDSPRPMTATSPSGPLSWRPKSNRSVKRVRPKQQLPEQNSSIDYGSSPTWSRSGKEIAVDQGKAGQSDFAVLQE